MGIMSPGRGAKEIEGMKLAESFFSAPGRSFLHPEVIRTIGKEFYRRHCRKHEGIASGFREMAYIISRQR